MAVEISIVYDSQLDSEVPTLPNLAKLIGEYLSHDHVVTSNETAVFVLESVKDPSDTCKFASDTGTSVMPVHLE